MTDTEYRTEFSIWCLLAAPLLVATDVRNLTDIMKEVINKIYKDNYIIINIDSLE